ncbi:MAG: diguanylate cyclase [Desulfuromonadales bacterium]|nr:diguanylate cyclase [Desulfuromonadales bacterium]
MNETALSGQPELLNVVLDHLPQGIVVVGPEYEVLAFNRTVDVLFNLSGGTFRIGEDFREIIKIWVNETGQDEAMRSTALARLAHREYFKVELSQWVRGEIRWVLLTHNPLPGGGFVRTFTDITEHKRLEEKLREISRIDSLTGLLNRHTFFESLAGEIERSKRYGRPLTLMSIDIDHFKLINDTFGHPAGDRVLREFAQALLSCMRKCDHLGRVGGEEFAVLLPEMSLAKAVEAANRILSMVRLLVVNESISGLQVKFTVIGVAETHGNSTFEQLVWRADEALYRAKREGRDCYKTME